MTKYRMITEEQANEFSINMQKYIEEMQKGVINLNNDTVSQID